MTMPTLSYKSRFIFSVVEGFKPHSIRAWRKRPFRKGDTLMHYTAMRTKQCRKIRTDTICTAAVKITIFAEKVSVRMGKGSHFYPPGWLNSHDLCLLTERDGFAEPEEFFKFFAEVHGRKFRGQLIEWDPFAPASGATAENGEPAASARVAPLTPVPSSPAAAGKSQPRGPERNRRAAAASPRAVK